MTLKQAVARIEELEKRVRELEARPIFIPVPQPYPVPSPIYPMPCQPIPYWQQPIIGTPVIPLPWGTITCDSGPGMMAYSA